MPVENKENDITQYLWSQVLELLLASQLRVSASTLDSGETKSYVPHIKKGSFSSCFIFSLLFSLDLKSDGIFKLTALAWTVLNVCEGPKHLGQSPGLWL